ncbi:MAG TPA: 4-hydroxythreonine-4-phosphate dehydrogenase PdxA [Stellaceae bacterium]|nr:4-hydroxythreonine-4-phosphate dehydrogenase PdxA [Stellaceae bacterium]
MKRIAISMGDPAGIGPEIALKAALDPRVTRQCRPLLVGDPRVLEIHAEAAGLDPKLKFFASAASVDWSGDEVKVLALDLLRDGTLELGTIKAAHGQAALASAKAAIDAAMSGAVDAVIAAPQTESAIKAAGVEFDGYPTFVARCTGTPVDDAFLMICFDDKRIAHVTLHVSLARAIALVTKERVGRALAAVDSSLKQMGIARPKIAVSGLNPHAGEGGLFGREEIDIIIPAIAATQAAGIAAEGPFAADLMFHRTGYDAFLVMIHDQGHIVAKLLSRNRAAGLTIGTPVLFSSVAHGSALDIAGQGKASHAAIVEAVERLVGAAQAKAA